MIVTHIDTKCYWTFWDLVSAAKKDGFVVHWRSVAMRYIDFSLRRDQIELQIHYDDRH